MTSGVKEAPCYMHLLLSPTSQTLRSHPVIIQKTANINSKDKIKKNTQHSSHQSQSITTINGLPQRKNYDSAEMTK